MHFGWLEMDFESLGGHSEPLGSCLLPFWHRAAPLAPEFPPPPPGSWGRWTLPGPPCQNSPRLSSGAPPSPPRFLLQTPSLSIRGGVTTMATAEEVAQRTLVHYE